MPTQSPRIALKVWAADMQLGDYLDRAVAWAEGLPVIPFAIGFIAALVATAIL